MAIIINIDVMLAKKKDERHQACRESWDHNGQRLYIEKRKGESNPIINIRGYLQSFGMSAR